jgi:hypothetical protein
VTIICVKDGVMAVDRRVCVGDQIAGTVQKWVAVPEIHGGGFAAFAGAAGYCQAAMRSISAEGGGMPQIDKSLRGIWLTADGSVLEMCESGFWSHSQSPYYAQGMGWDVATGAMEFGASAEQAAEVVCRLCPTHCGGGIDVLRLAA